jgi:S-DNA-T family DNA segregation ATPase FtsK/SpoIIIE
MGDINNKKNLKVKELLLNLQEEDEKVKLVEKKTSTNTYIGIIGMVVGLILFIIVYSNNTGYMGQMFFAFLSMLFGRGSYLLPLIIIGFSIYYFVKKDTIKTEKTIYLLLIFVILVASFHVASVDVDTIVQKPFGDAVKDTTSISGGIFGSVIGTVEMMFFGQPGTIFFNIAILIMLISLMSGRALITFWLFFIATIKRELDKIFDSKPEYDYDGDGPEEHTRKKGGSGLFDFVIGNYDDDDSHTHTPPDDGYMEEEFILPGEFSRGYAKKAPEPAKPSPAGPAPTGTTGPMDTTPMDVTDEEIYSSSASLLAPDEAWPEEISEGSGLYRFPPLELIKKNPGNFSRNIKSQIEDTKNKLQKTLKSFGVNAIVTDAYKGPTVTRYEISPGEGVKVSRISSLSDDIALNLAAPAIRIEAPIPGKPVIGIEIPNKEPQTVYLREIIESTAYKNFPAKLSFAIGKDIEGNEVVSDISKMPHLLIAGATGSGKSVCINTLIISILYKATPDEVKLLMVDPKVVELSVYNGIPHLLIPVVTDPKKAAGALNWAVREMADRYNLFSNSGVRDITGYNNKIRNDKNASLMPNIVIIIDELADLMMTAQNEVEDSIGRLAQMARAAGLHLIIATQRPSVDVITGVIKANIPSRLAFAVSSGTDSRTILDMVGAEKLLGKGDMLFYPMGMSKPQRIQGAFVSDKEVESVVAFFNREGKTEYNEDMITSITSTGSSKKEKEKEPHEEVDEFFEDAMAFVISKQKASISLIQRQFRVGYNRAARIIEGLEQLGVIGHEEGSKPRKVLWALNDFENYKRSKGD